MVAKSEAALAERAQKELRAACDALSRATALFRVLQHSIATDEANQFDSFSLAAIGIELTSTYAERVDGEADYFADVCSTSQGGTA